MSFAFIIETHVIHLLHELAKSQQKNRLDYRTTIIDPGSLVSSSGHQKARKILGAIIVCCFIKSNIYYRIITTLLNSREMIAMRFHAPISVHEWRNCNCSDWIGKKLLNLYNHYDKKPAALKNAHAHQDCKRSNCRLVEVEQYASDGERQSQHR